MLAWKFVNLILCSYMHRVCILLFLVFIAICFSTESTCSSPAKTPPSWSHWGQWKDCESDWAGSCQVGRSGHQAILWEPWHQLHKKGLPPTNHRSLSNCVHWMASGQRSKANYLGHCDQGSWRSWLIRTCWWFKGCVICIIVTSTLSCFLCYPNNY